MHQAKSQRLSKLLCAFVIGVFGMFSVAAQATSDPLLGKWAIVGTETNKRLAVIEARKSKKNNKYYFVIVKNIKGSPNYKERCTGCPKPFTNKKLEGMVMGWNLTRKGNTREYVGGVGFDPWDEKYFQVDGQVSRSGDIAFIKASPLETKYISRKLSWVRVK